MPTACGSRSRPILDDPASEVRFRIKEGEGAFATVGVDFGAGVAFVARDSDAAAAAMPDAYRAVRTAPAPLREGVVTLDVDRGRVVGRGLRERR